MEQDQGKEPKSAWWQPAINIFFQITGWIAGPIIIALYVGRALDRKYDSHPWWFLGLTAVAFAISSLGIAIVSVRYIKKIEKEVKNKKNLENKNGRRDSQFRK